MSTRGERLTIGRRRLGPLLPIGVILLALVGVDSAGGWTARDGNLQVIRKHEDRFFNYDFTRQRTSRRQVDWTVNLLFWNGAEIDLVKSRLDGFASHRGSRMNARLNDGVGWVWDRDGGRKDVRCPGAPGSNANAYHYRIYADEAGGDRMFNMTWGFYVFGTSHIDHNECPPGSLSGRWFGRSERAEKRVALWSDDVFGPDNVDRDRRDFRNREPFRRERNHIWLNNGQATYVDVGDDVFPTIAN